jgi:hypothetical protein
LLGFPWFFLDLFARNSRCDCIRRLIWAAIS